MQRNLKIGDKVKIKGATDNTSFTVKQRWCSAAGYSVFLEGVSVPILIDNLELIEDNDETEDT